MKITKCFEIPITGLGRIGGRSIQELRPCSFEFLIRGFLDSNPGKVRGGRDLRLEDGYLLFLIRGFWIVYYSPKKICSRKAIDTNEGNKLHDS